MMELEFSCVECKGNQDSKPANVLILKQRNNQLSKTLKCIFCLNLTDITTQDGVAIAGSDFEETNEQFNIEAGSSVNLTVHILDDNDQSESSETFSMVIYNKDGDLISHTINNSANVVIAPDLQCRGKIEYFE